jgi:hypothetical protein
VRLVDESRPVGGRSARHKSRRHPGRERVSIKKYDP